MRGPNQPALDGFTIRRKGDAVTKVRVVMYLEQQPEQYKVHPDLGALGTTYTHRISYSRGPLHNSQRPRHHGGVTDGRDPGAVELY